MKRGGERVKKNRIEASQGEAILLGELKQRSDQLGINCRWLIERIDRIHRALCPDQCGTWQQRAEQAVAAAERLLQVNGE